MFRHLLALIWKRKARHMMVSLEIMLAFVIVFAIAAFGLRNVQLYQLPTGFDNSDLWSVRITSVDDTHEHFSDDVYEQFKRSLEALPQVKQVAFANVAPYKRGGMRTSIGGPDGKRSNHDMLEVSDDWFAVMGVKLEQGRSFERSDNGASAVPVVVNRRFAATMFPGRSALGQTFDAGSVNSPGSSPMKVVGLIDDLRKQGELGSPDSVIIMRYVPQVTKSAMRNIMLKLQPGVTRAFEEALNARLKQINNNWTYEIAPAVSDRASLMNTQLMPIMVLSVIAAFLLLMVAFGLFGVLWQNTTRRIPELGLRRALGASAGNIYRQIIAEQFLLSSGAMLLGLFLLVQLPLTGALGESLNWSVFAAATGVSMTVIYLLSLLCSVYPGWRASRLSPTQALHYE